MIDRGARSELGAALRRLAAGRISNHEFEDQLPGPVWTSRDPGVRAIRWAAWALYDDLHEHRLEGRHALTREGRRHLARWILFLKSNDDYRWPEPSPGMRLVLTLANLVTLGLVGRALQRRAERHGEIDVWPFLGSADLARAVAAWPHAARGGRS